MTYILLLLIGLIFGFINYLIIKKKDNFINPTNTRISLNSNLTLNYQSDIYNNLENDVKVELEETYGIKNSELLINHNEKAKRYMLVES